MKKCLLALMLGASFVIGYADTWAPPKPRVFASENGSFGVKLLPRSAPRKQIAEAVMFSYDMQGVEKVKWKANLVNVPVRAYVSEEGHLVTVDTYANMGYKNAVVVYNKSGNKVADYELEDLLTASEIKAHAPSSVSSRHWAAAADFSFALDHQFQKDAVKSGPYVEEAYGKQLFVIKLNWGKTILIDTATGQIIRTSK